MRKYEGRLVGILGTLIIHLIAAIIFMSFKLKSINKPDPKDEFIIEFAEVNEPEETEKLLELPASSIERIFQGDEEMLNIARNLANRPEEKIDPADYIDKVKEELIKSGQLSPDNYIDEQKRLQNTDIDEGLSFNNETEKSIEKHEESQEMAANYSGPTRIYYELAGRSHRYLPIPIYKCPGAGKVVLLISVNQLGIVEDARVIVSETTASDPCLTETAITSALISRFNADSGSPKRQTGTLTYHFVAQ
ncbi:MAG: hypothetical protein JXN62_03495 [Bacteroidales bacterium]|nr:hypothetical protein [Bacteroidales bacterium]